MQSVHAPGLTISHLGLQLQGLPQGGQRRHQQVGAVQRVPGGDACPEERRGDYHEARHPRGPAQAQQQRRQGALVLGTSL